MKVHTKLGNVENETNEQEVMYLFFNLVILRKS